MSKVFLFLVALAAANTSAAEIVWGDTVREVGAMGPSGSPERIVYTDPWK